MFRDIGERFLRHAHHGQRGVGRQLSQAHIGGANEARRKARALGELARPLRERGDYAAFDIRRMQILHEAPARFAGGIERLLRKFKGRSGDVPPRAQCMLDIGEGEPGGGQFRAETVVDLAGDMLLDGFARLRELGGKCAQAPFGVGCCRACAGTRFADGQRYDHRHVQVIVLPSGLSQTLIHREDTIPD